MATMQSNNREANIGNMNKRKLSLLNSKTHVNNVHENASTNKEVTSFSHCWERCYYCPCESFKSSADFVKHLRDRHCTREGGSFVCRYGFNGVCPSLPLDGVSDRDYESHVSKYHVNQMSKDQPPEWSIFSASQNLPAVLNDPSRGKQSNLFTKKWGDTFVERVHIQPSLYLTEITHNDFERYLTKIGKRYRRHQRFSTRPTSLDLADCELQQEEPTSPAHECSLNVIPEIFLKGHLQLNHPPTFAQVFPDVGKATEESKQAGRVLQEKLSLYLDVVEVKIARQVSQKSSAFFHAMTSQDAIMSEMQQATHNVRKLRASLQTLKSTFIVDSFRIMQLAQRRQNYEDTLDKLRLMATVHKTQPMLQLLLGTQDYVAALDLIGTTQEIVSQELVGIHCFKHLPMQLNEMEKLIDKMLTTEFERYATADLNRPLSDVFNETDSVTAEEDKLVSIVMGLLRKKNFKFVDAYKEEAIVTIRAIIKQLVIEVISASDAEICLTGDGEEAQSLSITEWIALLKKATVALLTILQRIKSVTTIMLQTAAAAAGGAGELKENSVNLIDSEAFLTAADFECIEERLQDLISAVCNYCHERCSNLVSTQGLDRITVTAEDIQQLAAIVDEFSGGCEELCGVPSVPLKVAVKVQASRFANRFHCERKQKLALLLDSEHWRKVDIPNEFQKLIDRIAANDFSKNTDNSSATITFNGQRRLLGTSTMPHANPVLLVEGKPFALVGTALMFIQMVSEYCHCALRLPIVTGYLSHNVVDLLRTFNSRSCQLIIGTGAMLVAGLKKITSINLALLSRALQLILWLVPKVKAHFQTLDPGSVNGYESITKDYHSHIKEIESKICAILTDCVSRQLELWDARPPIPSQPFRNISRHLVKLHEAIAPILPEQQIHSIYGLVHKNFQTNLKHYLQKHKIANNGGPQHGVVTSELTFYMETMRTLKALPVEELGNNIMEDIWIFQR